MGAKNSLILVAAIATAVFVFGETAQVQARGIGSRGGTSYRMGISRGNSARQQVRYYGPSSYNAPNLGRTGAGSANHQMYPWYYGRSGPIEYYRPARTYYRSR